MVSGARIGEGGGFSTLKAGGWVVGEPKGWVELEWRREPVLDQNRFRAAAG